jgi:hypothetical protein
VHLGSAHSRARPARPSGPATWAGGPSQQGRGGRSATVAPAVARPEFGGAWRRGVAGGSGGKVVGWWTYFGVARRKSSPEEHALR